jgi:hypothetical protein
MVHVSIVFLSERPEYLSPPCLAVKEEEEENDEEKEKKKKKMTARVSMLLKSRASPDMFYFSPCNKKNVQFGT